MRTAIVKRKTKETDVEVEINLDGTGAGASRPGSAFSIICSTCWRATRASTSP